MFNMNGGCHGVAVKLVLAFAFRYLEVHLSYISSKWFIIHIELGLSGGNRDTEAFHITHKIVSWAARPHHPFLSLCFLGPASQLGAKAVCPWQGCDFWRCHSVTVHKKTRPAYEHECSHVKHFL